MGATVGHGVGPGMTVWGRGVVGQAECGWCLPWWASIGAASAKLAVVGRGGPGRSGWQMARGGAALGDGDGACVFQRKHVACTLAV